MHFDNAVVIHTYIHTYIYGIYNAQHGRACSSNQSGLLLGGSLGMEYGRDTNYFIH